MRASFLQAKHAAGLRWSEYLATDPRRGGTWDERVARAPITAAQRTLLAGFTRRSPMICLSGMWCGDCAVQCPLLQAIALACPMIDLVFLDRDEHLDLADEVRIAAGHRVPTVLWLTEQYEFVHLLGDRTLSRYRAMARTQLGAACPVPFAETAAEENATVLAEWLAECERVQWILRLSPRLRELHRD
ncbi:MAG: thiol reductase thioredoxin [Planctomycetes bacterium]|nr:thiol reductase thioredoxin [Planctomycetota bacterium]